MKATTQLVLQTARRSPSGWLYRDHLGVPTDPAVARVYIDSTLGNDVYVIAEGVRSGLVFGSGYAARADVAALWRDGGEETR